MLIDRLESKYMLYAVLGLFFALYIPTYWSLANTVWVTDEQGHGPIILLISLFLLWDKRNIILESDIHSKHSPFSVSLMIFGLACYAIGRSQNIQLLDVGSQVLVLSGLLWYIGGSKLLTKLWFPVFFLVFMVPLPGSIVDALTLPMKIAVSNVSEWILYHFDYPVARDGVIIQIGYYKLLVADACAGLHTVFSLEAMGLLYLHLVKRDSFARNVSLAILIIPISFVANTIRVITLILVTFYFGDEVGQGFVHEFAGFVLFGTALVLILAIDTIIHKMEHWYKGRVGKAQ